MTRTITSNSPSDVEVFAPNYFLQRKVGDTVARMVNPISLKRAEMALAEVKPAIMAELQLLVGELQTLLAIDTRLHRAEIYQKAHQISSLAATVDQAPLGRLASHLCFYLHGARGQFEPDTKLMSSMSLILVLAAKADAHETANLEVLLDNTLLAVQAQRQREGR